MIKPIRLAFASALLLAACATVSTEMRVVVEPPMYAAAMPDTPGIGLTPIAEAPPKVPVRYRWRADGGFFLSQAGAKGMIERHGREAVTEGGKLFWSYDPNEPGALEKRPVAITVAAENAKNGRTLARTDLKLVWDGEFVHLEH